MDVAAGVYAQAAKTLRETFAPLGSGSAALDGNAVQASVKALAESVVRNPDALLLLSKNRDTSVPAHARAAQVAIYMMVFARFLRLEREQIQLLGLIGLLQDVGKLRLPDGADEETRKRHVELSAHLLGVTTGLPPKLAALVLLHHERQDGMGYPRGLKGYQIGLNGAIAAICDRYDELLAPPPQGEGRSPSAAVNLLLNERGTAFHGPLVEQFIRCMGSFPVGSLVELSSGEVGVVTAEHPKQRLKPKVMLLRERKIVDLAAEEGEACRIRRSLDQRAARFDPRSLFS
jgi:HD-GYP domain-containing protein (c-di-GMP phosphodiesterase class II)